ncbi:MAG: hypothetical protein NTY68_02875 [Candidatus Micrarchaeota archaeon]|nr:hypothetical protein [Candidatus Micrarchaeota archaeon]
MSQHLSFIEITDSAPNLIDKYKGFVVLKSFNEGILSKISKNSNITVLVSIDNLISKEGIEKSKELSRIRRLINFLIKYSIRFSLTSEQKTKEELMLIGILFGLNYEQSREIVNKI